MLKNRHESDIDTSSLDLKLTCCAIICHTYRNYYFAKAYRSRTAFLQRLEVVHVSSFMPESTKRLIDYMEVDPLCAPLLKKLFLNSWALSKDDEV